MRRPIIAAILTIGITSMAAQIVLLRELIIIFYGNEISVGLMLAFWLLLGATGSLVLGRYADRIRDRVAFFCGCQIFISITLPILTILIRNIKNMFGFQPGEIMPLGIIAVSTPLVFAPLCIVLGFLFALSCKIFPAEESAVKIGRVYILESIGATVGGLLTSFLLIKYFGSLQILLGLGILNLIIAASLINIAPITKSKVVLKTLLYIWAFIIASTIITGRVKSIDIKSQKDSWMPFKIITSQNSIYGNVAVVKRDRQISFFTNGLHNFTIPDQLAQEEAVHFAMSENKNPKEILLIGGGAGGLLWEILKYPINKIDYVELDPLIIKLARRLSKNLEYYALDNPKVNIINTDGRFFIKNTSAKYDVIIISIPDPHTAQLNRFYTKEFFNECKSIMKKDGVLSFGVTSSENYISRELGNFLGSVHNTLKGVFSDVIYIPGDTAYFIAAPEEGLLTLDYKKIAEILKRRNVKTGFVNEYYLFSKLSKERIDYMGDILRENKDIEPNLDFRPISYYYDMILWSSYFGSRLGKLPQFFNRRSIWSGFILIYLFIITRGLILRKDPKGPFRFTIMAIGTTGFSEIVYEIMVVLSFQIIFGFLYYKLGLMLTSFMIGLFLGSIYITKRLDRIRDIYGYFTKVQMAVVLYPLFLPVVFSHIAKVQSTQSSWLASNIVFPALPIIAGFIGGIQFPLGNKICLSLRSGVGEVGGLTYGVDLFGACLGAIIVSAFLIPVIGIFETCAAVGLLNLSVLFSLILNRKKRP